MIRLTRLQGQQFGLNPDLIERAESTPDTVVTLVDGTRYVVQESLEEIETLIVHFRASIVAAANHVQLVPAPHRSTAPVDRTGRTPREGGRVVPLRNQES